MLDPYVAEEGSVWDLRDVVERQVQDIRNKLRRRGLDLEEFGAKALTHIVVKRKD